VRIHSELFCVASTVAIAALLGTYVAPGAARAQAAAPQAANQMQGDPPTRVGRLALITGEVSFHGQGDMDWSAATLNYPVVAGNSFWTQPGAEAELEFSDSWIALNESTELDLSTLDNTAVAGSLPQGEVFVHVRGLGQGETVAVATPRGTVTISAPGDYGLSAGDTQTPTVLSVFAGAAQINGTSLALHVEPGQAAMLTGTDNFQGTVGLAQPDAFLNRMLALNRRPLAGGPVLPPMVAAMPGGEDLASVGTWQSTPDYGEVWYPPAAATWVPYREGHWAYVAPWGWTWIDDAPWGFAPFHYGRWDFIGGRWGWVPASPVAPGVTIGVGVTAPIYAPALVAFFGLGAAVGFGGAAGIGPHIGWCPLGPGEAYHPWYHASPAYLRAVNIRNTNITRVTNVTMNEYRNARFATVVPAATLAGSRPVARAMVPVSTQQFATVRPTIGTDPARPTMATAGVTPATARQLHIAPAANVPPRHAAPGPTVHPMVNVVAGHPAQIPLRPPLTRVTTLPAQATQPNAPRVPTGMMTHPMPPAPLGAHSRPASPPEVASPLEAPYRGPPPRQAEIPHPMPPPHAAELPHPVALPHPAEVPTPAPTARPGGPRPEAPTRPAALAPRPEVHPAPPPHPAERRPNQG
jgi:hypothetical protein